MISYSRWRSLPLHTRVLIATQFGIAKVGPTHVVDNRVESDGYLFEDVENAITVPAVQEYTGSKETDLNALWDLLIEKAEGRAPIAPVETASSVPATFEVVSTVDKGLIETEGIGTDTDKKGVETITVEPKKSAPKPKKK